MVIKNKILRGTLIFICMVIIGILAFISFFSQINYQYQATQGEMIITRDGNEQVMKLNSCNYPGSSMHFKDNPYAVTDTLSINSGPNIADGGIDIAYPLNLKPENIEPWFYNHTNWQKTGDPVSGPEPILTEDKVCHITNNTIHSVVEIRNYKDSAASLSGVLDAVCTSSNITMQIHAVIENCSNGFQIM